MKSFNETSLTTKIRNTRTLVLPYKGRLGQTDIGEEAMLGIQPIKLSAGSRSDTGETGQGCFMNVVAYLNGDPQITDSSPCVCPMVRGIAIRVNDFLPDGERQRLLPFVIRALGSVTNDRVELQRRAGLMVRLVTSMKSITKDVLESIKRVSIHSVNDPSYYTSVSLAANAVDNAARKLRLTDNEYDVSFLLIQAGGYAGDAVQYAYTAAASNYTAQCLGKSLATSYVEKITEAVFLFLDEALPPAEMPAGPVMQRAARLCELATQ